MKAKEQDTPQNTHNRKNQITHRKAQQTTKTHYNKAPLPPDATPLRFSPLKNICPRYAVRNYENIKSHRRINSNTNVIANIFTRLQKHITEIYYFKFYVILYLPKAQNIHITQKIFFFVISKGLSCPISACNHVKGTQE